MAISSNPTPPTVIPQSTPQSRHGHRRPPRQTEAAPAGPSDDPRPSGHTANRGRRGGTRGQSSQSTPASQRQVTASGSIEPPAQSLNTESSIAENGGSRQGAVNGRGRRDRGSAYRGARGSQIRTHSGRQFGGQLTTQAEGEPVQSALQAEATVFVPGQVFVPRPDMKQTPRTSRPRPRKNSKSSAPDIATRIHEDIDYGVYECAICTNEIARNSKVWSCKTCWTVFHLGCIKKWSRNDGSAVVTQPSSDGVPPARMWRCPGCNLPKDTLPSDYTCWCSKETDPRSIPGLPPHSCGQTCSKSRVLPKKCPHPCELICHAGPCPPCAHMGPAQSCFCGKQSQKKRCTETDYDRGWSCGQICGDMMPCGEHFCERECHEGVCGACEVRIDSRCYCGQIEKPIICCERGDELTSEKLLPNGSDIDQWIGLFNCKRTCNREFDCGFHRCEKECHPQELRSAHCPKSPDVVTHCPCGKTTLTEILDFPRKSCQDPIPNCEKKCNKTLPCGHNCQKICHDGDCSVCFETVPIRCRCGRTTSATMCHQGMEENPQCMRICRITLNCGRHECGERCCSGEKKAAERQALRKKTRRLDSPPRITDDGFEAEHICTRPCGRLLKCGNHECQELCHKGPCGACREAIFDEIPCNCGRTILQPPLPCGTRPPPCRFDCQRPKDCGHPQVPHNCHGDDETCPKCPFLTQKPCLCGKKTLKNQQCWLQDVRCGEICGKKLKCGSHRCLKNCHRPGECEDASGPCIQLCGKPKKACGHPDEERCHAPYPCKEERPCTFKVIITCPCQNLKQELPCRASKTSEGNITKSLKCDDECARLERNRKLALALNIDPEAHKDDHVPYSAETLSFYKDNVKWSQTQEREFRVFAVDPEEKRLRFKPMPARQRAFIHSVAEDFGLDSESMDPEPHRHVAVFKTPKFVMAPLKTIGECVKIRALAEPAQKKSNASNVADEPFNGFVLTDPRFALTIEELRAELSGALDPVVRGGVSFDTSFLPNEEIVLKARPTDPSVTTSEKATEAILRNLTSSLSKLVAAKSIASSIRLCRLDDSLNILRREGASGVAGDGWSQVAAKAAAPRRAVPATGLGTKSVYTVLGSRLAEAKAKRDEDAKLKRTKVTAVVDDWEAAELQAEEEEKVVTGMGLDGSADVQGGDEGVALLSQGVTMGEEESSLAHPLEAS